MEPSSDPMKARRIMGTIIAILALVCISLLVYTSVLRSIVKDQETLNQLTQDGLVKHSDSLKIELDKCRLEQNRSRENSTK